MQEYSIWYTTPDLGKYLIGNSVGVSFEEACKSLARASPRFAANFKEEVMTYHGIPLFGKVESVLKNKS